MYDSYMHGDRIKNKDMHTVFTEIGPMCGDDERDLGFPLSSVAVHGGNRTAWRLHGKK
jgi:hypothetical protein